MDDRLPKQITEWSDTDKAFWILENGEPDFAWIFERNGTKIYRRPTASPGTNLPPWISTERVEIINQEQWSELTWPESITVRTK
jgi:hypothetical protein